MGGQTKISWTDSTWNPVTGCSHVSPGCERCYAERLSRRFGWTTKPWAAQYTRENIRLHEDRLAQPLHWRKPRRVFVCSMSDLFHQAVPNTFIERVFVVMGMSQWHTYQVLTKRPERMAEWFSNHWHCRPLPNVWLGVSIEDQRRADERIPLLLQVPAAVRFVSLEPLLGPVDLREYIGLLDWIIIGCESGPGARPTRTEWVRAIVQQCREARVPLHLKQMMVEGHLVHLPELDGQVWDEYPVAKEEEQSSGRAKADRHADE